MSKKAKALMLAGTGSDVGKTVLLAGLCRLARQRGLNVLPFKPQNMSNNAAVAQQQEAQASGEIGRGQWLQAFAAGAPPHVDMNPVLLKPQPQGMAQVIVQGQLYTTTSGRDYQQLKSTLLPAVLDSFCRLCDRADLVLVEGAGSVAEVNLRADDIANMGFARAENVPVVLVGDIDRGGVIASLVGTYHILPEADRRLIAGFVINKFRGDESLFEAGITAITAHTDWPCFGILPWDGAFATLPPEDSLASFSKKGGQFFDRKQQQDRKLKIVVPCLEHIANFDDLTPLETEEAVELVWLHIGENWPKHADLVILPGSKSTIAAMGALEQNGWAEAIKAHATSGGSIIGICGGLQMLGKFISDPHGLEGAKHRIAGLGLLDIETVLYPQKTVRKTLAVDSRFDECVQAYEIHLGMSQGADCANAPLMSDGQRQGAANLQGTIWGTYLHGLFANGAWRGKYLASLGVRSHGADQAMLIDQALDKIAALIERSFDIQALFALAR